MRLCEVEVGFRNMEDEVQSVAARIVASMWQVVADGRHRPLSHRHDLGKLGPLNNVRCAKNRRFVPLNAASEPPTSINCGPLIGTVVVSRRWNLFG